MKAIDPLKKTDILKYLAQGYSQREAFTKAEVSETVFYKWMEEKEYRELVHHAQDEAKSANADVRMVELALLDAARGFEYEEVRTEYESREVVDEKTGKKEFKPVIKRQVRTQKRVPPSTEAIKFLLTNRDPQNWKNRIDTMQIGSIATDLTINVKGDSDYNFPSKESELDLTREEYHDEQPGTTQG